MNGHFEERGYRPGAQASENHFKGSHSNEVLLLSSGEAEANLETQPPAERMCCVLRMLMYLPQGWCAGRQEELSRTFWEARTQGDRLNESSMTSHSVAPSSSSSVDNKKLAQIPDQRSQYPMGDLGASEHTEAAVVMALRRKREKINLILTLKIKIIY